MHRGGEPGRQRADRQPVEDLAGVANGAVLGLVEGIALGGALGWLLARLINGLIEFHARRFLHQAEARLALDSLDGPPF